MYLGREALGAKNIPVYVMPRMRSFLKNNAPWSQLVELKNIELIKMTAERPKMLGSVKITPILIPHRDEFSETVGYRIQGPNKTALFLPDIDKWERWNTDLAEILKTVDYAFIDATFFDEAELNYRPIDEIPHPLVKETVALLETSPNHLRKKVYFIHMNHTNPILNPNSKATKWVLNQGFNIARKGQSFDL
jgi:pyrroloquinoline quinone biosynthesis protein B